MVKITDRIDGVVIGIFLGFGENGPLVVFPGNPKETALTARTLTALSSAMIGAEVALLFHDGDRTKPLIVGRIIDPTNKAPMPQIVHEGETVKIAASERLELHCGKSTIILEKDGHITIRGTHLVSHASASNRIRGGSINLN